MKNSPSFRFIFVAANPRNTGGANGTTLNGVPAFLTFEVNQKNWMSLSITPASGKNITSAGSGSLILFFPPLPVSGTSAYKGTYLLPYNNVTCFIGQTIAQTCYTYPEVGWLVVDSVTSNLNSSIATSLLFKGLKNPPFAADLNGYLRIISINNQVEAEEIIYNNFSAFTPGTLTNVNVYASDYSANNINIQYNWLFTVTNAAKKGSLLLNFPNLAYNLESTPLPVVTISSGLQALSSTGFAATDFSFSKNVLTITGWGPIAAGTTVAIVVNGVHNPPTPGVTLNFGVQTMNEDAYFIDSKVDVPAMTIYQALPIGTVDFLSFYNSPNNGKRFANYYLAIQLKTTIPVGGQITIKFPFTEFDLTNFPYTTVEVSGAISTYFSKTLVVNAFTLQLDKELRVEPGSLPLYLTFYNVLNFNAERTSGVVTVTTYYDSVILDQSGSNELNRKAETSFVAHSLTIADFSFTPINEGEIANYTVVIIPTYTFYSNATIQFNFPPEYPRGLGDLIHCFAPDIERQGISLTCVAQDWYVNVTGHNGFNVTSDTDGFQITITGIINPNSQPGLSRNITISIFQDDNFIIEFTDQIGGFTLASAPGVMLMPFYQSSSAFTRANSTYTFDVIPKVTPSTTPFTMMIDFPTGFDLQLYAQDPGYVFFPQDATVFSTSPVGNRISFPVNRGVAAGDFIPIDLTNIPNPEDSGSTRYPILSFYSDTVFKVDCRTYDNLIPYVNPSFSHSGQLILVNNDNSVSIRAGTYSQLLTLWLPTLAGSELIFRPLPAKPELFSVSAVRVPPGVYSVQFTIGVVSTAATQQTIIRWKTEGDGTGVFSPLRTLMVRITNSDGIAINTPANISVPAGGRSTPINVTLDRAPYSDITIKIYQVGYDPTYVGIWPKSITFKSGQSWGVFWVSVGKSSKGSQGRIIYLLSGSNNASYVFANRVSYFYVAKPDSTVPIVLNQSLFETLDNSFAFYVWTYLESTVYYFVAEENTLPITFTEIKNKQLRYDYFGDKFWMGEYIDETPGHNYTFNITGLDHSKNYNAYIYIEGMNGALTQSPLTYYIRPIPFDDPVEVWMVFGSWQVNSSFASTVIQQEVLSACAIPTNLTNFNESTFPNRTYYNWTGIIEEQLSALPAAQRSKANIPALVSKVVSSEYMPPNYTKTINGTLVSFLLYGNYSLPANDSDASPNRWKTCLNSKISTIAAGIAAAGIGTLNTTEGFMYRRFPKQRTTWYNAYTPYIPIVYNNTVTIAALAMNTTGVVYAIVIRTTRKMFAVSTPQPTSFVRYLQTFSNTETDTQNPSTTANGTSNNSTNLTREYRVKQRNNTPTLKGPTCWQHGPDNLCLACDGRNVTTPNYSRIDFLQFLPNDVPPTPQQIVNGLDSDNMVAVSAGYVIVNESFTPFMMNVSNLEPNTNYTAYIIGMDNDPRWPSPMGQADVIKLDFTTPIIDPVIIKFAVSMGVHSLLAYILLHMVTDGWI